MKAAGWLNESGLARFYLVKLEAVRIGASPPAPLLTLITGPSEETTETGEKKKELAGRHEARLRFWTGLLNEPYNGRSCTRTFRPAQQATWRRLLAVAVSTLATSF